MRSTFLIITAILTASPVGTAFAQSNNSVENPAGAPGTIETARKLIRTIKLDRTYDAMFATLIPLMTDAVMGSLEHDSKAEGLIAQIEASHPDGRIRLRDIFLEEFTAAIRARYPALEEATAKEYAGAFTEKELQALLDFYQSGVGAKALVALPQLQARVGAAGRQIGQEAGMEAGRKGMERAMREMLPEAGHPKS